VATFGPVDPKPSSNTYGYITTTPKPGWAVSTTVVVAAAVVVVVVVVAVKVVVVVVVVTLIDVLGSVYMIYIF